MSEKYLDFLCRIWYYTLTKNIVFRYGCVIRLPQFTNRCKCLSAGL